MMVTLKGPNCHTATEDCTPERPAPHLQDPPIPVLGLAAAEVLITRLVEDMTKTVSDCSEVYFLILVNFGGGLRLLQN